MSYMCYRFLLLSFFILNQILNPFQYHTLCCIFEQKCAHWVQIELKMFILFILIIKKCVGKLYNNHNKYTLRREDATHFNCVFFSACEFSFDTSYVRLTTVRVTQRCFCSRRRHAIARQLANSCQLSVCIRIQIKSTTKIDLKTYFTCFMVSSFSNINLYV